MSDAKEIECEDMRVFERNLMRHHRHAIDHRGGVGTTDL